MLVDTGPARRPIVARLAHAGVRRLDAARRHPRPGRPRRRRGRGAARRCRSASSSTAATATARRTALHGGRARGAAPPHHPGAGQTLRAGRHRRCASSGPPPGPAATPAPTPTTARSSLSPRSGRRAAADRRRRVRRPRAARPPPVDVLKVTHHGSADPGLAGAAAARCARGSPHRGRRPQHLRPPDAGDRCRRSRRGRRGLAHRPRRRRPRRHRGDARCDGCATRRGGLPTGPRSRLDSAAVPTWKPAYLIHGDDHGRIAERRAPPARDGRGGAGAAGVEVFEGDAATPEAVAAALSAMTFAMGRRFVIVDGVERWKEAEVETSSRRRWPTSRPTRRSRSSPARTAARRCRPTLARP